MELGHFPSGHKTGFRFFEDLNKGFATLAKATKTDILPVAIIGADQKAKFLMKKNKIVVRVGDLIPFSDDIDEMIKQWEDAMRTLMEPEYAAA